jgi:phage FluMu gp28-like protein
MIGCVTTPKLIGMCSNHQHETEVSVAQFAQHQVTYSEIWCLAYVHPSITISNPAKKSPLGSDHANNNRSSRRVSILVLMMLMSATAVRDAQITAANPVMSIMMLYNANNMDKPQQLLLRLSLHSVPHRHA